MSQVGDGIQAKNANWRFNDEVAQGFDQHVGRSIPMYQEGHELVCQLSDFFIAAQSTCYELGCSTGELTLKLAQHNQHKEGAQFIGLDIEAAMIEQAQQKLKEKQQEKQKAQASDLKMLNVSFLQEDLLQYEFEKADLIVAYYTLHFIRPSQRQIIFDKLYEALNWGGALLVFEKVRANDARFQDICTSLYTDYKLSKGYSGEEIVAKSRSLKGILEPFSTQGNMDLLKRAGFVDILSVFKYISFEGFLAIK